MADRPFPKKRHGGPPRRIIPPEVSFNYEIYLTAAVNQALEAVPEDEVYRIRREEKDKILKMHPEFADKNWKGGLFKSWLDASIKKRIRAQLKLLSVEDWAKREGLDIGPLETYSDSGSEPESYDRRSFLSQPLRPQPERPAPQQPRPQFTPQPQPVRPAQPTPAPQSSRPPSFLDRKPTPPPKFTSQEFRRPQPIASQPTYQPPAAAAPPPSAQPPTPPTSSTIPPKVQVTTAPVIPPVKETPSQQPITEPPKAQQPVVAPEPAPVKPLAPSVSAPQPPLDKSSPPPMRAVKPALDKPLPAAVIGLKPALDKPLPAPVSAPKPVLGKPLPAPIAALKPALEIPKTQSSTVEPAVLSAPKPAPEVKPQAPEIPGDKSPQAPKYVIPTKGLIRDQVLILLKQAPEGLTIGEIADILDKPKQSIIKPIHHLTESNLVNKQGEKWLAAK